MCVFWSLPAVCDVVFSTAIDRVSRHQGDEPMKAAFPGKVAALFSACPGAPGGLRGLVHLRSILQIIGVMVLPDQYALGEAHQAFDDDGRLKQERHQESVETITSRLVDVVRRPHAP